MYGRKISQDEQTHNPYQYSTVLPINILHLPFCLCYQSGNSFGIKFKRYYWSFRFYARQSNFAEHISSKSHFSGHVEDTVHNVSRCERQTR